MSASLPSWTGQVFAPPLALDVATLEIAIVAQLQATIGAPAAGANSIEVAHFPDRPEAYRLTHRIGAALVIYGGANYTPLASEAIDYIAQQRELEFRMVVIMRDLGWAYGGQPSGTSPGAYQIIEAIRLALTGFQPNDGCTKMAPKSEKFLERDRDGGAWYYEMAFVFRTVAVENYTLPDYPALTLAQTLEEGGITARSVAPAQFTFAGAPGAIQLPSGNLSEISVASLSGQVYVANADYLSDLVNGIITRIASGGIPAAATVKIGYTTAEVIEAVIGAGIAPLWPHN